MRSRLIVVPLVAAWAGVLAACGSALPDETATPTPASNPAEVGDSVPDVAVPAYLALMDDLATELTRFGDPDGPGGSPERVIDLVGRLEAYTAFFFSLDEDALEQVMATYGQRLEEVATRVATLALAADEITGNETIVSALERTPSFAAFAADRSSSGPSSPTLVQVVTTRKLATMTEESFRALLNEEDVRRVLTTDVALTTRFFDYKAMAEDVDPSQVETIDGWYGLAFEALDGTEGLTFSAIDFDSASSAQDRFELMKSEAPLENPQMVPSIGGASFRVEVNARGIGSMLVFIRGDKLVSLHTARPDDEEPLLSLEGLEELAELVAGRL